MTYVDFTNERYGRCSHSYAVFCLKNSEKRKDYYKFYNKNMINNNCNDIDDIKYMGKVNEYIYVF